MLLEFSTLAECPHWRVLVRESVGFSKGFSVESTRPWATARETEMRGHVQDPQRKPCVDDACRIR